MDSSFFDAFVLGAGDDVRVLAFLALAFSAGSERMLLGAAFSFGIALRDALFLGAGDDVRALVAFSTAGAGDDVRVAESAFWAFGAMARVCV